MYRTVIKFSLKEKNMFKNLFKKNTDLDFIWLQGWVQMMGFLMDLTVQAFMM